MKSLRLALVWNKRIFYPRCCIQKSKQDTSFCTTPLLFQNNFYDLSTTFSQLFCTEVCQTRKNSTMDISAVVKEFNKIAPLNLAESWDNVGLLVETLNEKPVRKILFTNDLTVPVVNEAIDIKADVIYSYHPPIFAPLKRLQKAVWKHRIILTCIEKQMAIYSPHTALDASKDGVNDWLISCFDIDSVRPLTQSHESSQMFAHVIECETGQNADITKLDNLSGVKVLPESCDSGDQKRNLRIFVNGSSLLTVLEHLQKEDFSAVAVTKCEQLPLLGHGMGRLGKLKEPIQIQEAISAVKKHVGLERIRVTFGIGHDLTTSVSSVAVCAGSGISVLKGANAELYVTGEMSHHELLEASHNGKTVILCEHSNSERGFLKHLVQRLQLQLPNIQLIVSQKDVDPVTIL